MRNKKMRKIAISIFASLCILIGTVAFITPPEEPNPCLIPLPTVWQAGRIEGDLCSCPEVNVVSPEITCDHEECGQCQFSYCIPPPY